MKKLIKSIGLSAIVLLSITSCEFLGAEEDRLPRTSNGIEASTEFFSEIGNEKPIRSQN